MFCDRKPFQARADSKVASSVRTVYVAEVDTLPDMRMPSVLMFGKLKIIKFPLSMKSKSVIGKNSTL